MTIKTENVCPPIADRNHDFMAYDDNTYGGPGSAIGWGTNEAEAVADLIEQMELIAQVILEKRPDGFFDATVVTRDGVEIYRQAITTWQLQMRWENIAHEMRVIWDSCK